MRAHYSGSVQDANGALLPGAVISVCVNGTGGQTLLTQPVYSDSGVTNNTYTNPFSTPDGTISIYLTSPTRVDLLILPVGGTAVLYPDIDVNIPETAVASFTFPGNGPDSTVVGNNATANGTQSAAFGDTAVASGAQSTAAGQQAQATGTASASVGQQAIASALDATALGQLALATQAGATAVGQSAQATGQNTVALGTGSQAAYSGSAAIGAGAQATATDEIAVGTAQNTVSVPGILQAGSNSGPLFALQATTGLAGFPLENGTPAILSWTTPADGQIHRFMIISSLEVTTTQTGGAVGMTGTDSSGAAISPSLFAGGESAGGPYVYDTIRLLAPGTTLTLSQTSAQTAGAATLWAEIWGS